MGHRCGKEPGGLARVGKGLELGYGASPGPGLSQLSAVSPRSSVSLRSSGTLEVRADLGEGADLGERADLGEGASHREGGGSGGRPEDRGGCGAGLPLIAWVWFGVMRNFEGPGLLLAGGRPNSPGGLLDHAGFRLGGRSRTRVGFRHGRPLARSPRPARLRLCGGPLRNR